MPASYGDTPVEDLAEWMGDRRTELADLAIQVIADRGYQALSFRNLAREAGVSTMTFTYSFENRDRMLDALIDRVYSRTWRLRGFHLPDDQADPLQKLWMACKVAIQDESEIDPFQRVLDRFVLESPYSESTQEKTLALDALVEERYCRLINLAKEQGLIDPMLGPSDTTQLLWSLGDGLNTQRYANPALFPPERMRALFDVVLVSFLRPTPAGKAELSERAPQRRRETTGQEQGSR